MAGEDRRDGSGHTLDDHRYGLAFDHVHDGDADHDHDDLGPEGPLEENPIWLQDHVFLTSVGIDIGSSGTQVIFSRLELLRHGEDLSSRYYVVARETLYQSPVALTPYQSEERIDERRLGDLIGEAYAAAGLHPDDIDAGAVILTGEALRRENAQAIAGILAEKGGEFVCAAAGHHMEAMLAAYGSGAARVSHDDGKRILNVDIGGGTSKLAIVEGGRVVATAALHVGGRLQVVDGGRITRLDPAGRHHARQAGYDWSLGDAADPAALDRVAEGMADALIEAILTRPPTPAVERLFLTEPFADPGPIDGIMFSGGVGEYVYGNEERDFGDMGRRLGVALRRRIDAGAVPWPLLPAGECIRATALGASEYSVQLSGNTSYISEPGRLLPRRNLQVLQPPLDCDGDIDPQAVAAAIRHHCTAFDALTGDDEIALALRWRGEPAHERILAFGRGIRDALAERIAAGQAIFVMLDGDVAQTLGAVLREELGVASSILVIDGLVLRDFDYVDLGRIRLPSRTVPVTIKSLVFNEDPRGPRPHQRLHHRDDDHHGHHHHGHGHHHHHGHDHSGRHHHHHGDGHGHGTGRSGGDDHGT